MDAFYCKTRIIAGRGAIQALKDLNIQKLMVVCDPFFHKNGMAEEIIAAAGNPEHQIFSDIVPDPSLLLAAQGAAQMQAWQPDTVVALGGGSTMDCAKAMTYFSGCTPRLVAIPTTSGSGSEVTDFAILTHEGVKHPLVDDKLKPNVAILDDSLLTSLPQSLIADGGFDLISHAVEAYVARNSSHITRLLAADAFTAAAEHLLPSFRGDVTRRGKVHLAATMAGISFSQAGLGLCHAIAHSIGGSFHTPHGRLNAILLPAVMDQNAAVCGDQYANLARFAGLSAGSNAMALRALKNMLIRLRHNLQLPETLAEAGITPAQLSAKMEELVKAALADPCCSTNPMKPNPDMIRAIITEVAGRG
jgi:alcohol dehydrogenase class IV